MSTTAPQTTTTGSVSTTQAGQASTQQAVTIQSLTQALQQAAQQPQAGPAPQAAPAPSASSQQAAAGGGQPVTQSYVQSQLANPHFLGTLAQLLVNQQVSLTVPVQSTLPVTKRLYTDQEQDPTDDADPAIVALGRKATTSLPGPFEKFTSMSFLEVLKRFPRNSWEYVKDDIDAWQNAFAYTGFNPLTTIEELCKKPVVQDRLTDALRMIMLCLERGTNINSIKNRMNAEGQSEILLLCNAYGLKSKAKSTSPKEITLSRVVLSLPWIACDYSDLFQRNRIVSTDTMDIDAAGKVPKALQCISFPALIPSMTDSNKTLQILKAYCWWSAKMSITINKAAQKKSLKDVLQESMRFAQLGQQSTMCPNQFRLNCCKEWGIVTDNTEDANVVTEVTNLATKFDTQ